jgi:hypothetical protein
MESWLKCQVSQGMFSTEFAVEGTSADGTGFSLFAPEEHVEVDPTPKGDESVPGYLRVAIWQRYPDAVVLRLPSEVLGGNYYVTVRPSDLETRPAKQQA